MDASTKPDERKVVNESQVKAELNKLYNNINVLIADINTLEECLVCVLREEKVKEEVQQSDTGMECALVPLAEDIRSYRKIVDNSVHRIKDLISRIEV